MAHDPEPTPDSSWQRAVDRSLGTARARAVSRSAQILDAARSLMLETQGIDFTVQDIVDRSGLSLRSFYKHFAGKDELLVALLQELLREFAADLRAEVEVVDDPVERLHAYVMGFYLRADQSSAHGGRALGVYHVRMVDMNRDEFALALAPQMDLLHEILVEGVAAGRFRSDLSPRETTGLLTVTLMSAAQMSLLDVPLVGAPLSAAKLWAWCALAVGVELSQIAPTRPPRATARRSAASRSTSARPAAADAPARKPASKRKTTPAAPG